MTKGLKGSEISSLPQTDEEFIQHIEREHHIPVFREGETEQETIERFLRENPEAGGPACKCPVCVAHSKCENSLVPSASFEIRDKLGGGVEKP